MTYIDFAKLDGCADALRGCPPQAAQHFCAHELDRDGSDWPSYLAGYMAAYRAAQKDERSHE